MNTLDNLTSAKANPAVKHHLFSRRRGATSIVAILLLGASLILPACGQTPTKVTEAYIPAPTTNTPKPTATSMPTETPAPTATNTPEPTATPVPLEGRLFFDMNGSGLMDQASFNYDPARLTDERQPLQPDLLAALLDYVNAHPDLQAGDLITLDEPGLTGYTVCVADNCAVTAADGSFAIANPGTSSPPRITITDPNAGAPALEMRYVNRWNGAVVIPAYEMNGGQVPEQHLNDTQVLPITSQINAQLGSENDIGLMQGFRTMTLPIEAINSLTYITGFDHNPSIGAVLSFSGDNTFCSESPFCSAISNPETPIFKFGGIFDSHPAYDYFFPLDNDIFLVFAGMPGVFDSWNCNGLCASETTIIPGVGEVVGVHGHIYKILSSPSNVFRGQIISLTGELEYRNENPNYGNVPRPHYELGLRFGPFNPVEPDDYVTSNYKDPYAVIDNSVPMNFPNLEIYSSWTVFNLPIFP